MRCGLTGGLLAVALLAGTGSARAAVLQPSDVVSPQLRDLVETVHGPSADAADDRYDALRKLDGPLQALTADRLDPHPSTPDPHASTGPIITPGGRALVDVYVNGPMASARRALTAAGLDITAESDRDPQRLLTGWLPAGAAPAVAALGVTRAVVAVDRPMTGATPPGTTVSLGDLRMSGPAARSGGDDGAGVSVGVISDSINADGGLAASKASANLPPNVTVLKDGNSPTTDTDEGRAMAELLYDTAPGIPSVLFSAARDGPAAKASQIDALVANHVRVITDDTTYVMQPFFQDGVVEQAVDRARAAGVAYFAAAGNSGDDSWEGTYAPTGSTVPGLGLRNDFDPGSGVAPRQSLGSVPPNGTLTIVTQWDEAWGRALTNGFTLRMFAGSSVIPVAQCGDAFTTICSNTNVATLPVAALAYKNTTGASQDVSIELVRSGSGPSPFLKSRFYRNFGAGFAIGNDTNSPTIGPDAAGAAGALSVGAVWQADSGLDTLEPFSSRGPLTHYFDGNGTRLATAVVRAKPELAAPDGVQTTVPGFDCAPGCFFGTSAASPAAAGVAALLWSAKPSMPISTLVAIMTNPANAIPCTGTAGIAGLGCGAGFIQADRAIAQAKDDTPPTVTASVSPSPDGTGDWYRTPPTITWILADPQSPVTAVTGCVSQTITTDGSTDATCTAMSAGGTTVGEPVTVRVDLTPPSAPSFTRGLTGIYRVADLPAAASIGCSATDATSGVAACTVTGYDASVGPHQLTATATNGAGLTSTSSVTYVVVANAVVAPTRAATSLVLGKRSLATLRSRGLGLTVAVAKPSTRLTVTLKAKLPGAKRATTVGTARKTVSTGKRTLIVKLTRKASAALKRSKRVSVAVTVVATASGAAKATLTRSLTYRR